MNLLKTFDFLFERRNKIENGFWKPNKRIKDISSIAAKASSIGLSPYALLPVSVIIRV
ncbi:MAG: hypothetical protein ABF264_07700 [Flavobacteriales bacterium]